MPNEPASAKATHPKKETCMRCKAAGAALLYEGAMNPLTGNRVRIAICAKCQVEMDDVGISVGRRGNV